MKFKKSEIYHLVFFYCVIYTLVTLLNSIIYLLKGIKNDPAGNWHELDRAIIVFILITAYGLIKYIKTKRNLLKIFITYLVTLLLSLFYVCFRGLNELLAPSAYRDIFINFSIGFVIICFIYFLFKKIKSFF